MDQRDYDIFHRVGAFCPWNDGDRNSFTTECLRRGSTTSAPKEGAEGWIEIARRACPPTACRAYTSGVTFWKNMAYFPHALCLRRSLKLRSTGRMPASELAAG